MVASGPRLSTTPTPSGPTGCRGSSRPGDRGVREVEEGKAVGRPGEGLSIDYQIVTNIRSFEYREETKDSGYAHVEVFVKVMDDRNGRIVATRTITGDAPVAANTPEAVVAGLDAAMAQVLDRTGALDARRDLSRPFYSRKASGAIVATPRLSVRKR